MKVLGIILGIVVLILAAAWLKLRGPDIPYETLEAKYAGSASHFVDLPGGFHVHYEDQGDPRCRWLVLLHGFGDSYTGWEGWVRELQGKFRIITLDFPGHGLTRAPEGTQLTARAWRIMSMPSRRNCRSRNSRWPAIRWAAAWPGSWPCAIRSGSMP